MPYPNYLRSRSCQGNRDFGEAEQQQTTVAFMKQACGQDGEGQEESDKARLRSFSKEMRGRKRLAESYSLYLFLLLSLLQMLSRLKPAVGGAPQSADKRRKKGKRLPQLEELLTQRDFTGGIALLEVLGIHLGNMAGRELCKWNCCGRFWIIC